MIRIKNISQESADSTHILACGQINDKGKPEGIVRIISKSYIFEG